MRSIPIIMGAESVLAIKAGRKTQSRRLVTERDLRRFGKILSDLRDVGDLADHWDAYVGNEEPDLVPRAVDIRRQFLTASPWGRKGDVFCVREALRASDEDYHSLGARATLYAADGDELSDGHKYIPWRWKGKYLPGMFMPKAACRFRLPATAHPRIERLQGILESDCLAEGIQPIEREYKGRLIVEYGLPLWPVSWRTYSPIDAYARWINRLYPRRSGEPTIWDRKPYMWVLQWHPWRKDED